MGPDAPRCKTHHLLLLCLFPRWPCTSQKARGAFPQERAPSGDGLGLSLLPAPWLREGHRDLLWDVRGGHGAQLCQAPWAWTRAKRSLDELKLRDLRTEACARLLKAWSAATLLCFRAAQLCPRLQVTISLLQCCCKAEGWGAPILPLCPRSQVQRECGSSEGALKPWGSQSCRWFGGSTWGTRSAGAAGSVCVSDVQAGGPTTGCLHHAAGSCSLSQQRRLLSPSLTLKASQ